MGLRAFASLVNGDASLPSGVVTSGGDDYFIKLAGKVQPNINGKLIKMDVEGKDFNLGGIDSGGVVVDANKWTPIGNYSSDSKVYSGTFDGNGNEVSGLAISNSSDYQGLFGCTSGATIKNLGVSGSVSGASSVGGVVGANDSGNITNCYSNCTVTGSGSAGGVVGWNNSTIANCYNLGTVTDDSSDFTYIGGVVGYNLGSGEGNNGTVTNCYNTGSVSARTPVGGVVGYNYSGTVSLCYYLSSSADYGVGGTTNTTGVMTDMKTATFASTLDQNAYNYNNPSGDGVSAPSVAACAWVDNSTSDYPTLNFGVEPTTPKD